MKLDCTTASPVFIMCVFLLISRRQYCAMQPSVGLSAASSCYRWTGGDSDHEVAPPLPFIIPSWRLRSGLTLALPLPFLFLSLHTAFLISLGHPIYSHETGDRGLSIQCCHLLTLHHLYHPFIILLDNQLQNNKDVSAEMHSFLLLIPFFDSCTGNVNQTQIARSPLQVRMVCLFNFLCSGLIQMLSKSRLDKRRMAVL